MPTYGYECLACDNAFEIFQSIKDAPLTTCDSCGGALRKRIYPVGIAFKGPGFYVNDYGSKPKSADSAPAEKTDAPKADATPASGAADTAPATSETKTEPVKTEPKAAAAPASA